MGQRKKELIALKAAGLRRGGKPAKPGAREAMPLSKRMPFLFSLLPLKGLGLASVALLALVLIAADASAGPLLQRLRERRSGGCTPTYTHTGRPAVFAAPGGCAGGSCPIR